MKPIRRERYDISRDKRFTNEFNKYVAEQKYVATSRCVNSHWFYEFEHADDSLTSAEYRRTVDELMRHIQTSFSCLIQFWRTEEERVVNNNSVGERRFLLTLRNQPFLLIGFYNLDVICRYRTKMHDVIVNGDGTGGPIGRVFQNNKMECTPNVLYYSDNEYPQPQRDIAKSCGINCSLVLPWRDCNGGVVGAIEFVSPYGLRILYRHPSNPLHSNSRYSDYCQRLCWQYDSEKDSLISAVTEINEVIGQICEGDYVDCAQTWMLCKHCSSLSTARRCAGELKTSSEYFIDDDDCSIFLVYEDYYNLKKGEGVVGKAAELSHDLVYCEDVAKLGITEYPLAHFARECELSASFAIGLKSNQTGDQVYVLEFFLHPDYVKGKNLRATLVPILETMRQRSHTFKFASGGETGDSLYVQVIDARFSEKNETFQLGELYLMDNSLASADSIENGGSMLSNLNEREFVIMASTEKLYKAQNRDQGRESAIGVVVANTLQNSLPVVNFLSTGHNVKLSAEKENIVMQQGLISTDGTDVRRFFPEDFKKYVYEENLLCGNMKERFWVFSKEHESGVVGYALPDLTNRKFDSIIESLEECLVQFWIAEERGDCSERLVQLESRNQPFLLIGSDTYDGICTYRIKMSSSVIGNKGVINRVYRNNRMEFSPNVGHYSSEEYPQLYLAMFCGLKSSLVFPLYDLLGRPVGVCELVSPNAIIPSEDLISDLSIYPNNGLKWLNRCEDACGQYDSEQIYLQRAVSEINEVMEKVGESFDLLFGQTWMLCKSCNSLCISERYGEELGASYIGCTIKDSFLQAESFCILQKGEGVVGKVAATSHNLVYCENVAKFRVTEYPLSHLAREYNLSACFALCIQSNHTGNQVYVLEVFLSPDYIKDKDLKEILVPLLDTMRQSFRTFKFASGGELKNSVSVQVIDANSPDRFETFEIGALDSVEIHSAEVDPIDNGKAVVNTTEERDLHKTLFEEQHKSVAVSGDTKGDKLAIGVSNIVDLQQAARNGNLESMVSNIDERNVQTATQTYADEPGRDLPGGVINFVHTDQNDVGFPDECFTSPSKLANERGGIDISLEELMQEAGKNREDAAKNLNVSISTLKRACRHHGISRWPPRKRNLDNQSCSHNSTPTSTRKTRKVSASAVQNQSSVKIKAKTLFEEQHKSFAVSGDTKGEKLAIGVSNIVDLQQAARNGNLESMVSNIDERNVQTATQTYADEPGRDLPGGVINFVHTDQNDVGFPDECFTSPSKLANERGGIDISLEELMQEAGKNREDAAKNLNVSISTLKRACRHHGISRWPPRKRNLDNQSCSHNSTPTSTRKTRKVSASAVQNQSSVKIKAKYKDICIKFDISASSGIDVFHYEVSKRLKLAVGDYTVKYQDEDNDWIIITCNDDLRDYISCPTLLGKNNLVISLERV